MVCCSSSLSVCEVESIFKVFSQNCVCISFSKLMVEE